MVNLVKASQCGWTFLWLALLQTTVAGEAPENAPTALLTEAAKAAEAMPPASYGIAWGKPLVLLRIADTMRLHGMQAEALATARQGCTSNKQVSPEECRDQDTIELCRLLTLLGQRAEAESLAETAKFRNYSMPARYMIARASADMGDTAAVEAVLRHPCFTQPDAGKATGKGGSDMWRRACVGIALEIGRPDLARQLIDATTFPLWKSGGLGDLAVAHAKAGRRSEALKTTAEADDAYMAVIGLARVADELAHRGPGEPLADVLAALRQAADKVSSPTERDYALGIAVSRLAGAGCSDAADSVAQAIRDPLLRLRAQCELLTPERLSDVQQAVAACPEADRPLVEQFVAVACARHGMTSAALSLTARISDARQRRQAQSAAARALLESGRQADAARLAQAAAATTEAIESPAWRVHAHVQTALDAERTGLSTLADRQLRLARDMLARVTDADLQPGLVVCLADALAAMKRGPALREFGAGMLKADPSAETRNRLLPILASAGETATVVAECQQVKVSESKAMRAILYRFAQHGELAQARAFADKLSGSRRIEALADIALAQVPARKPSPSPRKVGVALNGGWASWFPRLERMGLGWELMPATEPYELGAAGLAAKYRAIGYPGGGGHEVYTGIAGVENIRDYLYRGGGYLGICAGQYLATQQHYLECDSIGMGCPSGSPHQVQMRKGHLVCLGLPPVVTIARRNGGILIPRPGCDVLGWYDTIERYAALVAQDYGYGRVVALSPHPEGSSGLDPRDRLCMNALWWITRGLP